LFSFPLLPRIGRSPLFFLSLQDHLWFPPLFFVSLRHGIIGILRGFLFEGGWKLVEKFLISSPLLGSFSSPYLRRKPLPPPPPPPNNSVHFPSRFKSIVSLHERPSGQADLPRVFFLFPVCTVRPFPLPPSTWRKFLFAIDFGRSLLFSHSNQAPPCGSALDLAIFSFP